METGVDECLTENMAYGVCVENIADTTGFQAVRHIGEALVQELVELLVLDAVVFDGQSSGTFEGKVRG